MGGRVSSESDSRNLIAAARASAEEAASAVSSVGESGVDSIHSEGSSNRNKATQVVVDAFLN
jgi:vacuolar-type H+-ATPase subunit H